MLNRFLGGLTPILLAAVLLGSLPAEQELDIARTQATLEGQRLEVVKANRAVEEVFGPMPAVNIQGAFA